jgi:hypothetical protein
LKISKSWEPFWSSQLNSTANSAYSPQKWAKWAELVVLFSWYLQNGTKNFDFSIIMGPDYSIDLISINIYVPQFIGHNKNFLGSVGQDSKELR